MGKTTTLAERLRILELANEGLSDRQIADRVGLAPVTVRKWRRRGMRDGRPALASTLGRPRRGALSTFAASLREVVQAWRQAHPGWGPKTLRAQLASDPRFANQPLPHRATLARFLKGVGLAQSYARHTTLPEAAAPPAQAPHDEWELDARGAEYVPHVGMLALIDLVDRASHARLHSYPCWLGEQRCERHPRTGDYQTAMRLAFTQWGLPAGVSLDHDTVFYDVDSPSPFPTRFHLWLLALGLHVRFTRVRQPTDHALVERSHQLWADQVLVGATFLRWEAVYQALYRRQHFLNYELPCAALGEKPPLVAHPEAAIPRQPYRPEWEAELLRREPVDAYLAQGRWFRQVSKDGTVSLGGHLYSVGRSVARQQVELTFDPKERHLVCRNAEGSEIKRVPLRGISAAELMGDRAPLVSLPDDQSPLPFTWDDWLRVRLRAILSVRLNAT